MVDWAKQDLKLIQEASRHAEAKLAAQVQIAISADNRASILCGVYAAAASGTLVLLVTNQTLQASIIAQAAAWTAAVLFWFAAAFCVWAIWPCDFHLPGNEPGNWKEDFESRSSLEKATGEQLDHFDGDIRENNRVLARNAWRFQIGVFIGLAAPLVAAATAMVAHCLTT